MFICTLYDVYTYECFAEGTSLRSKNSQGKRQSNVMSVVVYVIHYRRPTQTDHCTPDRRPNPAPPTWISCSSVRQHHYLIGHTGVLGESTPLI